MTTFVLLAAVTVAQIDGVSTPEDLQALADRYPDAARILENAYVIPGLNSGYVPQGVAAIPGRSTVVLSCYHDSGTRASVLAFMDADTGRLIRTVDLTSDGAPVTGHVGGLTVCRGWLWTAFDGTLYRVRLPAADELERISALEVDSEFAVDSNTGSLSSTDGVLWVGDFAYGSQYPTPAHHHHHGDQRAWVAAYAVDESGDLTAGRRYLVQGRSVLKPDRVVFVRQKVQGFAVCNDVIALSTSYGADDSTLTLYESPLAGDPFEVPLPDANETEGYVVDGPKRLLTIRLPAGSEDLEWSGTHLLVPFESAADRYRWRWQLMGARIEDRFYLLAPETRFAGEGATRRGAVRADRDNWTPAGLLLRAGQSLHVEATGRITLQKNDLQRYPYVNANGQSGELRSYAGLNAPNGCLLVRIGDIVYQAGTDVTLTAESGGFVELGILEKGQHANNDGQFEVEITVLGT